MTQLIAMHTQPDDLAPTCDFRIASTLRRCRNQFCRPLGVTREEEQAAIEAGLLRYVKTAPCRYVITDAGHEFLSEH